MLIMSLLNGGMAMAKTTAETTTEAPTDAASAATFENTLPRYPLVDFLLMLTSRFKATKKPADATGDAADQTGNAPVLRQRRTPSPGQA